jgi:hypothetical protein
MSQKIDTSSIPSILDPCLVTTDLLLITLRSNNTILLNLALVQIVAHRRDNLECGRRSRGSEALDDVVFVGDDACTANVSQHSHNPM